MEKLTFEQLPQAVGLLIEEVQSLKRILREQHGIGHDSIIWFNLTQLCEYLSDKPAKATVYSWVNNNLIPYHKGPKKLRFSKFEIDLWLKQGRKKTADEIAIATDKYLITK